MMTLAVLLLSFAGFAALAASMRKHHRDWLGHLPSRMTKRALVVGGWTQLAASLAPAILAHGLSIGIVLWFGIATVAALTVAMGLTYGPRAGPAAVRATPKNDRPAVRPEAHLVKNAAGRSSPTPNPGAASPR